jgi:hypothetical protein
VRRINRHGINGVSTVIEIERYLGPRRSSCGTLIRGCLADTQLNTNMVMARCLGTGPWVPRQGIEARILISHASSLLGGVELSWSMVVRACNTGKGPGQNHLCRWIARGPRLGAAEWGGGIHLYGSKW